MKSGFTPILKDGSKLSAGEVRSFVGSFFIKRNRMNLNQKFKSALLSSSTGFTLIETFVAITVLLIAVLGPMSLFARAISDGIFARNQVVAFYLAQEGAELILNQTYSNNKQSSDGVIVWDTGLTNCDSGCSVFGDGVGNVAIDQCTGGCGQIYFDPATGIYSGSGVGNNKTIFRRVVKIKPVGSDGQVKKVESTVFWNNQVLQKQFTIERYIYNLGANTGIEI